MILFKNIYLSFNEKSIFDGFNLSIETNEKVLLTAPSGSGKTSLVKMLMGILKYKGELYLDQTLLTPKTKDFFRKQIAYVSQDVDLQNLPAKELIETVLSYKVNKQIHYTREALHDYLIQFGLTDEHLEKQVNELSGGERARFGLIIALILDRPILILDEVTSGLDPLLKETMIQFVMGLDKTVLIISHDEMWKNQAVKVVNWVE